MKPSKTYLQALEELEEFRVWYNGTHPNSTVEERNAAVQKEVVELGKKYYSVQLNIRRYK